ncbi:MAG: M23 family metallopeptidase, partial [Gallicola sp.]|nr:M23 family metallopeptidase [Gallicola sp.]
LYKFSDTVENGIVTRAMTQLTFEEYLKNHIGTILSQDDFNRWVQRKESHALDVLKRFGSPFPYKNWELKITSRFGYRIDPIKGGTTFHDGLDIAYSTGTPIHSPISGTVKTFKDSYGALIVTVTKDNVVILMAHLDSFSVQNGQSIQEGQIVGTVGNTGYSTGPHLHISIKLDGEKVDPMFYLKNILP